MKKAAYLAFVLLGVIWGSNFIFMKWAAQGRDMTPNRLVRTGDRRDHGDVEFRGAQATHLLVKATSPSPTL